jgi:hypothetical protein
MGSGKDIHADAGVAHLQPDSAAFVFAAAANLHRLAAAFDPRCPDAPAQAPLIELSRGFAGIPDRGRSAVLTLTLRPPAAMLKR